MKIGLICYPTYGGSGVVATELGRVLAQRGHMVHFISSEIPFRLDNQPLDNVIFHEVQSFSYPLLGKELYTLSLASKTIQIANDYGLDIIHAHYAIPHAISAWIAREAMGPNSGLRIITTLHGTDATLVGRAPSFFPVVRFALRQSDANTAVSRWLADETEREFEPQAPIEVIPNFIDPEKFRPNLVPCKRSRYAPNGEKILLHISNFRPVKRINDVIRIFARVQAQLPARLILIGDGPDRDQALGLARDLGVGSHVVFLGKQEHIELFFSCADLFLFPSEYESFGLAAAEAMAAQVPVVCSNGGALSETVRHGETGMLADVGDIEAMVGHALALLRDDERRKQMGRAARADIVARYHPDQIVPMYEALYERVLNSAVRRHASV